MKSKLIKSDQSEARPRLFIHLEVTELERRAFYLAAELGGAKSFSAWIRPLIYKAVKLIAKDDPDLTELLEQIAEESKAKRLTNNNK